MCDRRNEPRRPFNVPVTRSTATYTAESFTAEPSVGRWQNHPYSLKAVGDLMYTAGINRYIIHRYAHQPWTAPTLLPGNGVPSRSSPPTIAMRREAISRPAALMTTQPSLAR